MTYPVKSDKSSEHLVSVIIPAFNAEELSGYTAVSPRAELLKPRDHRGRRRFD
jgi:hypothetical protein